MERENADVFVNVGVYFEKDIVDHDVDDADE